MNAALGSATRIHPTAVVAAGAQIGQGAEIGPFCTIGPDAVIGDRARLISHVVVDGHTSIGAEAVLYPFVTVGMAPQDVKYRGEPTRTEIGPRVQLREHVTVHRGTPQGTGVTRVGAGSFLLAVSHVAHDCDLGQGVIVANNVVMGGHVRIGDNAYIGGSAAIHQFVRIGRAAMVGGVAGVEGDVIPFGLVLGNRARLAGLNIVGLKRRGVEKARIQRLRAAFRTLFATEGVLADRLSRVEAAQGDDDLVAEIVAFMRADSHRGLIRARVRRQDEDEAE